MKQANGSCAGLVDCVTADKGMCMEEDETVIFASIINHQQHSLYRLVITSFKLNQLLKYAL